MLHTRTPDYREASDQWFVLELKETSQTTMAIAPMLEAGARLDLDRGWVARIHAAVGAVRLTDED